MVVEARATEGGTAVDDVLGTIMDTINRRGLFSGVANFVGGAVFARWWPANRVEQPIASERPWNKFCAQPDEPSAWDDYHSWRAWMEWKFIGRADMQAILDDADSTTAVRLYLVMGDLFEQGREAGPDTLTQGVGR